MSFTPLVPAILKMVPLKYRLQVYRLFFSRHLFFFSRRFEKYPELFENCRVHFAQGARLKLCPTDQGHAKIALTSVYEPELSRQISSLARIGGLLVDVGANYGYYSVLWTYGHLSNRVIAFEASPRNIIPLKHNIASNGLLDRVEIFQKALGRDRGSMRFLLGPERETGWGGLAPPPPLSSDSEELSCNVDVLLLDDFKDEILTSLPLYRVLKIDVEGADTWVIEGAHSLLRQKVFQHIFFECNRPRMRSLGISEYLAHQILQDCGFKIKPLTNPNRQVCEYHAYCH